MLGFVMRLYWYKPDIYWSFLDLNLQIYVIGGRVLSEFGIVSSKLRESGLHTVFKNR